MSYNVALSASRENSKNQSLHLHEFAVILEVIILSWQQSAFVIRKSHKQFFSWWDLIMTDFALFSNCSTILVLLEINDNGCLQRKEGFSVVVSWFQKWIKRQLSTPIQSNSTSYPRHQSGKEQKDDLYQLELPTIETLPWKDQYKINGGAGGLKLLRIYTDRTFMPREFSLLTHIQTPNVELYIRPYRSIFSAIFKLRK